MEDQFRVRDRRNKGWWYADNEYLNGYAKIFGPVGSAIYFSLCRHADDDQKCFPAQGLIAEEFGISRRTVLRHINKLEEYNLIHIEKGRNTNTQQWENNVYWLLDKSEWKPKNSHVTQSHTEEPCDFNDTSHVTQSHTKNTNLKNTNIYKTKLFFEDNEMQGNVITYLKSKGIPEDVVLSEMKKFVSYWTEPNQSGTKVRWESERFFDIKRRIATWFSNIKKFNKQRPNKKIIIVS